MSDSAEPELIGMAEIARLAGQSRSTVGNWKNRYEDFPKERSRNPRGPLYSRDEVVAWLASHLAPTSRPSATNAAGGADQTFWSLMDSLRSVVELDLVVMSIILLIIEAIESDRSGRAVEEVRDEVLGEVRRISSTTADELSVTLDELDGSLLSMVRGLDHRAGEASSIVAQLIDRLNSSEGRAGSSGTPRGVARMLAAIVGGDGLVFDPCLGYATVASAIGESNSISVVGQEANRRAAVIGYLNLRVRSIPARVHVIDSIRDDATAGARADIVVAIPPFGLRLEDAESLAVDPRWVFGEPGRNDGDLAWIQIGLANLSVRGRMAVVVPPSVLFASGNSGRMLQRIIKHDLLDCVITLPPRLFPETGIASAILVFDGTRRDRSEGKGPAEVLLVDGEAMIEVRRTRTTSEITSGSIDRVRTVVDAWRHGLLLDSPGTRIVGFDELAANEFILAPHRYERSGEAESVDAIDEARTGIAGSIGDLLPRFTGSIDRLTGRGSSLPRTSETPYVPLGRIEGVSLLRGVNPSSTNPEEGIPVLSIRALRSEIAPRSFWIPDGSFELDAGDILVSLTSPSLGEALVVGDDPDRFVPDHTVVVVRVDDSAQITAAFLQQWLRTPSFRADLERLGRGSALPRVSFRDLASIGIPVPDLVTQGRLVDLLKEVESSVQLAESLRSAAVELEELTLRRLAATFGRSGSGPEEGE